MAILPFLWDIIGVYSPKCPGYYDTNLHALGLDCLIAKVKSIYSNPISFIRLNLRHCMSRSRTQDTIGLIYKSCTAKFRSFFYETSWEDFALWTIFLVTIQIKLPDLALGVGESLGTPNESRFPTIEYVTKPSFGGH